jgi:hypothetical protein
MTKLKVAFRNFSSGPKNYQVHGNTRILYTETNSRIQPCNVQFNSNPLKMQLAGKIFTPRHSVVRPAGTSEMREYSPWQSQDKKPKQFWKFMSFVLMEAYIISLTHFVKVTYKIAGPYPRMWIIFLLLFFLLASTTHLRVSASSFLRFRDHTQWHDTVGRTPLDEWSACRRDLYLRNTQHSQQTNIHAPGGIQTRNPSRRSAADPRLRPLGHWDRQDVNYIS